MAMSKAKSALDQKEKTIRFLVILNIGLMCLLANAHIGVMNVPKQYTFWTPPDLSVGGQARIGEVPETSAFNFAFTMFGGVNTWEEDGSTEFPKKLRQYQNWFGNSFLSELQNFAKREQSNYRNRSRQFIWEQEATEVLANNNGFIVEPKGNNVFHVTFAARVIDKIQDYEIRNDLMVYHFIVEPHHMPRHLNPWQLKISGQFAPSQRL